MKRLAMLSMVFVIAACGDLPTEPAAATNNIITASFDRSSQITMCHYDPVSGQYSAKLVNVHAEAGHRSHGDGQVGDPVPGMAGYEFDSNCQPQVIILASVTYLGPRGQCNEEADLSGITGVPSRLYPCQGLADATTLVSVNTRHLDVVACPSGIAYYDVTGFTGMVEQNGASHAISMSGSFNGLGYVDSGFNIDDDPITVSLTSVSIGTTIQCDPL